jgi:cytochrome d ubiquinol oxidase subunit II
MDLVNVWFLAIALLWLGFLLLEGFDFGVGLLLPVLGRTPEDRSLMLRTIGPVWDGNEVWLVTAIGATFAAFPSWYAGWLSTSYLLFVLLVVALIGRAVSFEWRHAEHSARWERHCSQVISVGSAVAALGVGAALGGTTIGLPLDANGVRVGGPLAWATWGAALGGVAVLAFSLVHGSIFLALKLRGPLRTSARTTARRLALPAAVPLLLWAGVAQVRHGTILSGTLWIIAVAAAVTAWSRLTFGREGQAFIAWSVLLGASLGTVFLAAWPVVLPSTVNAGFDLTAQSAAVSGYTLTIITWVTAFGLPAVLTYQGWTYWVFRHRLSSDPDRAAATGSESGPPLERFASQRFDRD